MGSTLGGYVFYSDNDYNHIINIDKEHSVRLVNPSDEIENIFTLDAKILDINSKTGLYPLFVATSIYMNVIDKGLRKNTENLWEEILENNVYAICRTKMAAQITRRTLRGFKFSNTVNTNVYVYENFIEEMKNKNNSIIKKLKNHATWGLKGDKEMKFNAIVGNPPYQIAVSDSGKNQHDMPIYHSFYDISFELSKVVTLISPARFLTGSGYTPGEWNTRILNDKNINIKFYTPKSAEVFPNTDIKGGVTILLRDKNSILGPIGLFTPNNILTNIVKRINNSRTDNEKTVCDMMYVQTKMNLDLVYKDFPKFLEIRPKSSIFDVRFGTDSFTIFADMFSITKDEEHDIEIYGLLPGNKRASRFISKKYLQMNDETSTRIEKWKVLVPSANGSGTIGETISTPIMGTPIMGHTMSFRTIGAFDNREEAENLLKYVKTKFTRLMIGSLKSTQHMPPKVFKNVPIQNFKNNSDIDWSLMIDEIDKQLYQKYLFTKEEIEFTESNVQPMK
jgi:hypothetical protein